MGLYRLDFKVPFFFDLKEFWKNKINEELKGYEIINLASKEFSSLINHEMIEVKLVNGKTIKQSRGKTLDLIIKNKDYKDFT